MEIIKIDNLSFTYPNSENKALDNINLSFEKGEFVVLCGKSGCGKTTLLRLLKSSLAPTGKLSGNIIFNGKSLGETEPKEQAEKIGFVQQNPDSQIVTDKVWHELAFGLESLGVSTPEIRAKVSEMAAFFGIESWFYKKVSELSGGQKQLLNLASVMVTCPSVLILDEPTSQLDPIAAQEFLNVLKKINKELGVTIIISEHRLEDALTLCDRVLVLDNGKIIADGNITSVGNTLKHLNHEMYDAFPVPMRVWGAVDNELSCPVTACQGRKWLDDFSKNHAINHEPLADSKTNQSETVIEIKDGWFRYEKNSPDVIKGLNLKVKKGEILGILGGNGVGKTTALSLISGIFKLNRGKILINGKSISETENLYDGLLGVLPQNPEALFIKNTVFSDLLASSDNKDSVMDVAHLCRIDDLLNRHPYDLSGGEKQRVALAKVLLCRPRILLLDEPTKGMDASFKKVFKDILDVLKKNGVTILMVSHDLEFCAEVADRCALFFDGAITSSGTPREFFAEKYFYTTSANRMARDYLPDAITAEDIILACGGKIQEKQSENISIKPDVPEERVCEKKSYSPKKIISGLIFGILFILTCAFCLDLYTDWRDQLIELITFFELFICITCFLPKREFKQKIDVQKKKISGRTILATLLALIAVPITIYIGMVHLEDKKYYFISILIILETMIPFAVSFESRKPNAREMIIISVLCALTVAGRTVFFMVPQFKPVLALVIISGICFGAESGFLVGAASGFISNFFFGQGPWTPWQMFAYGAVGFVAGIVFRRGLFKKTRLSLCVYGFLATFLIFGLISNTSSVILWQPSPTVEMFLTSLVAGVPFDFIHAVSTVFFLWFLGEPMVEKLERVKLKYNL